MVPFAWTVSDWTSSFSAASFLNEYENVYSRNLEPSEWAESLDHMRKKFAFHKFMMFELVDALQGRHPFGMIRPLA